MRYDVTAETMIIRMTKMIDWARQNNQKPMGMMIWPHYSEHHIDPDYKYKYIDRKVMYKIIKWIDTNCEYGWIWGEPNDKMIDQPVCSMEWFKAWKAYQLNKEINEYNIRKNK